MKKILSLSVLFLFSSWCFAQNSAELKLNLEKNKVYRFTSLSQQTIVQTVNGMAQNVESKSRYDASLKMADATPDFMILEIRYDTVDIRSNAMGRTTVITSTVEGDVKSSEMSQVMTWFMNKFSKNSLFVKMDYAGKVLEILNLKMFSDIVLKDTSSITLTGPVASAVKMQIANMFSDKTLITLIEMFTWNLPGKQVSAGDTWDMASQINSGGMLLDIATKYRLGAIKEYDAVIAGESSISAAANATPINSGGATVTYDDLKGISKYDLVIDIRTGLLKENTGKSAISGNLGVSAPGLSMQIPMEINGETKVKALP